MKTTETEMELDAGCPQGEWPQPKFAPRRQMPTFTEMAVQTAVFLVGVGMIVAAGVFAWLDISPK